MVGLVRCGGLSYWWYWVPHSGMDFFKSTLFFVFFTAHVAVFFHCC